MRQWTKVNLSATVPRPHTQLSVENNIQHKMKIAECSLNINQTGSFSDSVILRNSNGLVSLDWHRKNTQTCVVLELHKEAEVSASLLSHTEWLSGGREVQPERHDEVACQSEATGNHLHLMSTT